ncbi:family 43 glycosylhydrolase [Paenarthrobacter nicotinovorans]|uniref:family 43 glycosylhydrolase n=1 Tax=Paenarthrobacter nicotinovorans TaxID=29320 RepID=UPI003749141F
MTYDSFRPGQIWLDTNGRPIQAHGFSVFEKDGVYYWYGENKERTKGGPFNRIWHWGVRCYSSTDLYNWEDRGLIIPPQPDDLTSPLHPTYGVDRPHIIYSEATGKFVAWLKVIAGVHATFMVVMEAESFLGPYEFVRKVYNPLDMYTGDFTVVNDSKSGEGYLVFDRPHFEIVTATLTPDRTAVTGEYSTHYQGLLPPHTREAPAWFERDGVNYLFTSGTSWYYANPSTVCSFTDWHGEYTDLGDPCIDDKTNTTFYSQISSVLRVAGTDQYIALADRWKPGAVGKFVSRNFHRLIERGMQNPSDEWLNPDRTPKVSEISGKRGRHMDNTSVARYVWLPIEWHDNKPVLRWHDEWRLDHATANRGN